MARATGLLRLFCGRRLLVLLAFACFCLPSGTASTAPRLATAVGGATGRATLLGGHCPEMGGSGGEDGVDSAKRRKTDVSGLSLDRCGDAALNHAATSLRWAA
eukprot:scaffold492_cov257-Pinguiococcus_pyrenoidosus.AAC.36